MKEVLQKNTLAVPWLEISIISIVEPLRDHNKVLSKKRSYFSLQKRYHGNTTVFQIHIFWRYW